MPRSERIIYHCDMNAYFVSVEELYHPELRNVPMAICGDPKSRRGIIVAKNEKAKAFGIKTASDMKKPNAVTLITRENYREKIWPLRIGEMYMVGKAAEAALLGMNIRTVGDLAGADLGTLKRKLGKHADYLYANAHGLDMSPVVPPELTPAAQSIGKHNTFKRDLATRDEIKTGIMALADSVATSLRRERVKCMAVQVTIKDPKLVVITRQKSIPPTWLAADLVTACMELIDAHWPEGKPVRLLAVTAMKLVPKENVLEQVTLFDSPEDGSSREREERLEMAIDKIRGKYGTGSISKAGIAFNDIGIHDRHGAIDDDG